MSRKGYFRLPRSRGRSVCISPAHHRFYQQMREYMELNCPTERLRASDIQIELEIAVRRGFHFCEHVMDDVESVSSVSLGHFR
jgi:hypothetical protein